MRDLIFAGIRSKLVLLGVLALLPVVLLMVFNSWYQRKMEVVEAKKRMARLLNLAVIHEEEAIQKTHRLLATLAELPIVRKGGKPANEFLAGFLKNSPDYSNIGVARLDGQILASAIPFNKSVNISDQSFFRDAVSNRSFAVGCYQVGRITGKPGINFGYPVLDRQGKVNAVVFTALDLSHVTEFEAEVDLQIPGNSSYMRLDSNGAVLTSRPASQLFGRGHPLERSLFGRISKEKTGMFQSVGADGVERLYLFSPFHGPLNKEGGFAILGIPTKLLFSEVNRLLGLNLVVLSVVGVLFLAIVWFGGNTLIVRPVGILEDASKRLAAGDFSARTELLSTQGELGQLSRAFDEMAEELQRRQDESLRMQEALRVSAAKAESEKARTEAIIAGIGDGISIQDREYRIIFQNQVQKSLVGDHVGEFCYSGYENRGRVCEDCPLALSFSDGRIHTRERIGTVNGKTIYVEVTASPLRDASGNIVAGIEVVRDISERKRIGEALKLSEERFRVLSEQSPLGMALIDRQGRYEYVNPAFVSIFGYTLNDVPTGADWFRAAFPDPDARIEVIRAWRDDLASSSEGEARPRTFDVTCKDGARKSVLFRPVSLSSDRQFVIYEDVTRQQELQAQLQQAMKMEAVGRLAGGVAHDFNNLLTVIMGNVALALGKVRQSAPIAGMLSEVNKAAERAAALTQQLLAFSRKQIIEPKVLNLNDLIADMNAMLVRLIREDIKIRILPGKDIGAVKVDAGQFQQVLANLVVNARDALPDGGKIVIETSNADLDDDYCSRHPHVKPGRFVIMAVSDTGHGMSEEVKKHIFEPFFTTKAKGSGTGLGLATTYGAVKQAGGSIEVYSEVGIGTTLKIYLPRVEDEVVKPVEDDQPAVLPGGTETVLVVEDDDLVRTLCAQILERLGYKVLHARSGAEAIALVQGGGDRIELLLTDVVMPGMNGSELATQLVLHHPEIKVLFTSGYTDDAISHRGVLDDGVSFIGKPYTPSTLARKVREVLGKA